MTNEERKVLELALDWIEKQPEETPDSKYDVDTRYVVIREIEAALAQPEQEGGVCGRCGGWVSDPVITQPEQEPVVCDCTNPWAHDQCTEEKGCKIKKKLLRTPPQRKPLSDEQKKNIFLKFYGKHWAYTNQIKHVMEAVEAAHGIKE
jgi:hypothetical protein